MSRAYFLGSAKIQLKFLDCEADGQQDCLLLEPRSYGRAAVSRETLHNACGISCVNLKQLLDAGTDRAAPPLLTFPRGTKLHVLAGRHRFLAAQEIFADEWWAVDLYTDEPPTIHHASEECRNPSSGNKFRLLRLNELNGDRDGIEKWRSCLSKNEKQTFDYIFKKDEMSTFAEVFDELIPIVGLWSGLTTGSLHDFVYMKCPEELTCYWVRLRDQWRYILDGRMDLQLLTDSVSVNAVETLYPELSDDDRMKIEILMDERKIFAPISSRDGRAGLKSRLLTVSGRILSFATFNRDALYLQPCSKILRELLPEKFQGSVRKKLLSIGQTASISKVQYTESQLAEARFNSGSAAIAAGYCQLYLFVMRNCASPVKAERRALFQAIDQRLLPKMANLATELGFKSQKIRLLCGGATAFHTVDSRTATDQELEFAADTASLPKQQRWGKPDHAPHYLFLDMVCNDNKSKRKQNATVLAIQCDIFMSFFGNLGDIRPLPSNGVDDGGPYLQTVGSRVPFRTSSFYSDISQGPFKTGCSYSDEPDCIFDMYATECNGFAPGFEDESHTMEDFHAIPTQRKVSDIVRTFVESSEKPYVLFDYHIQRFAKFATSESGREKLQLTLQELAEYRHIFVVFLSDNRFGVLSHEKALAGAESTRLVLVGRRNCFFTNCLRSRTQNSLLDWVDSIS